MAKTTFILEADEAKAVKALLKVVDAQNKATAGMRKMGREGQQAGKSMETGLRSVASILGGLSVPAALMQGVRKVVQELEKVTALRKEMMGTAAFVEEQIMKIAHLRGDVSRKGLAAVRTEVEDISRQTAMPLEVTSEAFFLAESGMGKRTPEAKSAALAMAKFGAPAGLKPEEISQLPKLFKIWGADTEEKQLKMLGQLQMAAGESIAKTGPYLQAFIEPMVSGRIMGFKFEELLASMTAAVEATGGVAEAGTAMTATLLIGRGKTEKALKFLTESAKKRGVDFPKLEAPERLEFTRGLYQELEKAGPAALDVFITRVGGKGFKYIQQMFGEIGERKYQEVLPMINAATAELIRTMAEQYLDSISALTEQLKGRARRGETRIGIKYEPGTVLDEMVTNIIKQSEGSIKSWSELIDFSITPGFIKRSNVAGMLIRKNLELAIANAADDTTRQAELRNLWEESLIIKSFRAAPEFVEKAYRATEGLTLPEKYGQAEPGAGLYQRGYQTYFGLEDQTNALTEHTKAIKEHTAALKENTEAKKIPIYHSVPGPDE